MIRLAVVTVLLAVGVVVVKRRQSRATGGEALRVASRTAISRGVMAAVLEVEQRRFLVTITPTSTTLVAELGPTGAPIITTLDDAGPTYGPLFAPAPVAATAPAAPAVPPAPAMPPAAAVPAPPVTVPAALAAMPSVTAPVAPAPARVDDGGFLDRLRARTVRAYDPELVAALRGER